MGREGEDQGKQEGRGGREERGGAKGTCTPLYSYPYLSHSPV